jgi:hypothetical protein
MAKVAVVLIGYVLAVVAAVFAGYAYEAAVNKPGVDTSGGMYAWGSALQIFTAFGVAALVPTGLALWFIRKSEPAWRVLSRLGLAFAITGPMCGACFIALGNLKGPHPELGLFALIAVFRLIGSPFLAIVFAIAALLAADKTSRWLLWIAAGIEAAVVIGGAGRFLVRM